MDELEDTLEKYFGKYIATKDITSKEYFKAAIDVVLKEYDLPIEDIATKFQIAKSTVYRWASGVAVPHPMMRQKILEWIVDNI